MNIELLKVIDAARVLNVSRSTIYAMIAQGVIPTVRLGNNCVRISATALEKWIAENTHEQATPNAHLLTKEKLNDCYSHRRKSIDTTISARSSHEVWRWIL